MPVSIKLKHWSLVPHLNGKLKVIPPLFFFKFTVDEYLDTNLEAPQSEESSPSGAMFFLVYFFYWFLLLLLLLLFLLVCFVRVHLSLSFFLG